MNQQDFDQMVENFESPERIAYQKPDEVLAWIGDLEGKTFADIGSGTGFFSFRLADAGASVIAIDIDERFQEVIRKRKQEKGLFDAQLQTRLTGTDTPSLNEGEVDGVLIVNTYHHIENRPEYFSLVRKGLKEGGALYVVDFFKKESEHGPPASMRLASDVVVEELKEAGFTQFEVETELLPEQYIIKAYLQ
jgi:cyclopropane fatty-acyl-phospholipid synthase-like methyltransferase